MVVVMMMTPHPANILSHLMRSNVIMSYGQLAL